MAMIPILVIAENRFKCKEERQEVAIFIIKDNWLCISLSQWNMENLASNSNDFLSEGKSLPIRSRGPWNKINHFPNETKINSSNSCSFQVIPYRAPRLGWNNACYRRYDWFAGVSTSTIWSTCNERRNDIRINRTSTGMEWVCNTCNAIISFD